MVRPGRGLTGVVALTGGSTGLAPGLAETSLPVSLMRAGRWAVTGTGRVGGWRAIDTRTG